MTAMFPDVGPEEAAEIRRVVSQLPPFDDAAREECSRLLATMLEDGRRRREAAAAATEVA